MRSRKCKRKGTRIVSSGRATKYQPTTKKDIIPNEDYLISKQMSEMELLQKDRIEAKDDGAAASTNDSSFELYKHMNSFPLEIGENESHRAAVFEPTSALSRSNKFLDQATSNDAKDKPTTTNSSSEKDDLVGKNQTIFKERIHGVFSDHNSRNNDSLSSSSICGSDHAGLVSSGSFCFDARSLMVEHVKAEESRTTKCIGDQGTDSDKKVLPDLGTSDVHDCSDGKNGTRMNQTETQDSISSDALTNNDLTTHLYSNDVFKAQLVSSNQGGYDVIKKASSSISHLVVLLSKEADSIQQENQNAALNLLDELDLPYEVVEGMDPSQHEDEYFKISGICANYPQIFVCEEGEHRYLGGYGWLKGSIADISGTSQVNALLAAASRKKEPNEQSESVCRRSKESVIVLISNGVADYKQKAHQNGALQLLTDLKIPYKIVDGMDIKQTDERNELFRISGIRGRYPQIFAQNEGDDKIRYLGGYDWLEGQILTDMTSISGLLPSNGFY